MLRIALIASLVLGCSVPGLAAPDFLGDLNEDGEITVADVILLGRHVDGAGPLEAELVPYGDVNADGIISEEDVDQLVDIILGLSFPTEPRTELLETSPSDGEGGVAVTRETILRFGPFPIDGSSVTPSAIFAHFGAKLLDMRLHVSPRGDAVTLFYDEPLPPNSRIRVTINGDLLTSRGRIRGRCG